MSFQSNMSVQDNVWDLLSSSPELQDMDLLSSDSREMEMCNSSDRFRPRLPIIVPESDWHKATIK